MSTTATIWCGDCMEALRYLPEKSIQCCVTSPPYRGLRDYGHGDQIGLERTPEAYVAKMTDVSREVWQVLRDDGTLWLNLGDCYATGAGKVGECPGGGEQGDRWKGLGPTIQPNRLPIPGLKPKDLVGIPWRVAFALQKEGWYLRSDIIWSKKNPLPESVRDRPTKSHEHVFLLTKSEKYFYDYAAVLEPQVRPDEANRKTPAVFGGVIKSKETRKETRLQSGRPYMGTPTGKRNLRDVWFLGTQSFKGAHFAVMPQVLVEPCVKAGSRPGDTVLDPFSGAGTVGVVALKHGRNFIGIDLNPEYCQMAAKRIQAETGVVPVIR